uniref:Uncharacterized protein n=1 Tax=Rhipicephalus zambeziensis TaxID=60191 RepID=A0A224YC86_9ACAR
MQTIELGYPLHCLFTPAAPNPDFSWQSCAQAVVSSQASLSEKCRATQLFQCSRTACIDLVLSDNLHHCSGSTVMVLGCLPKTHWFSPSCGSLISMEAKCQRPMHCAIKNCSWSKLSRAFQCTISDSLGRFGTIIFTNQPTISLALSGTSLRSAVVVFLEHRQNGHWNPVPHLRKLSHGTCHFTEQTGLCTMGLSCISHCTSTIHSNAPPYNV